MLLPVGPHCIPLHPLPPLSLTIHLIDSFANIAEYVSR
jgi:hypothetical protein